MKKLLQKSKGELTTKQLVSLIILIVSFVVILFLIVRLNLSDTTDAEICRNSVALKEQSKIVSGPIDCKTSYFCISGGSECQTNTEILEVDPGNKTEIMQTIAEKMAECWWMFGEGKVNYGSVSPAETKVEYALCSILEFSPDIQQSISYAELYEYLRTTPKTSSQTYLQYLYATNTVQGVDSEKHINFSLSDSIDPTKRYSILTGVDNNAPTKDVILKVYIIPTEETGSRLVEKREFITKA